MTTATCPPATPPDRSPGRRQRGTPPTLTIVPWQHPFGETTGHRPGDPYIEAVWLGVLGPSATWCWQRLARLAAARPSTAIDTVDLAVSLGLTENIEGDRGITRTLRRLSAFHAATRTGDTLLVRRSLPDVSDGQLHRLSYTARLAHERWGHPAPAAPATSVAPAVAAGVEP